MSEELVIVDKEDLTAIADAVRESTGSTEEFNVSELRTAAVVALSASSGTLTTHIEDKNNPHNVTIDQIGAAPAGLITKLINVANEAELETVLSAKFAPMRNRTMAHFYINPSTQDVFNGKATLCELTCWTVTGGGYGFARFTSYGKPNVIISYKALYGGVWQPMEDGSTTAFAPSGYGLGTTGAYCADANNANKSGWYGVDANTTNIPSGASGVMFVKTLTTANGTDIYQTITSGVTAIRRYYSSWAGKWQPWEYENPSMELGVEYRTTERWNGMPVYTKLVDCGAMPNKSTKEVTVFTGSECKILRVSGYTGYTNNTTSFEKFTLPYKVSGSYEMGCHAKSNGTNANIVLYSSYDTSGFGQTYVNVWYVKT